MYILGIDYGEKRIGLALASQIARLPSPFGVIATDDQSYDRIAGIVLSEHISHIVVGLPRNMDGSLGAQAARCKQFGDALASRVAVPVSFVDETLSSVEAADFIQTKRSTADLDAVAAAYIVQRYIDQEGVHG